MSYTGGGPYYAQQYPEYNGHSVEWALWKS